MDDITENLAQHFLRSTNIFVFQAFQRFFQGQQRNALGLIFQIAPRVREMHRVAAAIVAPLDAHHKVQTLHATQQTGHGGFVLVGGSAKLLLRYPVMFGEMHQDDVLLGGNVKSAGTKITRQIMIDGRRHLSIQNGENQTNINVQIFHENVTNLFIVAKISKKACADK